MSTDQEIFEQLMSRWFDPKRFCWRCGNAGFWFEQIDGPDNLRKVYCNNPLHSEQATTLVIPSGGSSSERKDGK